jgi:hypothetical protein
MKDREASGDTSQNKDETGLHFVNEMVLELRETHFVFL